MSLQQSAVDMPASVTPAIDGLALSLSRVQITSTTDEDRSGDNTSSIHDQNRRKVREPALDAAHKGNEGTSVSLAAKVKGGTLLGGTDHHGHDGERAQKYLQAQTVAQESGIHFQESDTAPAALDDSEDTHNLSSVFASEEASQACGTEHATPHPEAETTDKDAQSQELDVESSSSSLSFSISPPTVVSADDDTDGLLPDDTDTDGSPCDNMDTGERGELEISTSSDFLWDAREPSPIIPDEDAEKPKKTLLRIEYAEGKGRGVYGKQPPPKIQTRMPNAMFGSLSRDPRTDPDRGQLRPLFGAKEYQEHGKHTVLDLYTFVWRDGRMALALGLGSLFNDSQRPNVSYTIDRWSPYATSRQGECFRMRSCVSSAATDFGTTPSMPRTACPEHMDHLPADPWSALPNVYLEDEEDEGPSTVVVMFDVFADGDPDEVVPDEELPFRRLKLTLEDEEEEEKDAVRREDAWLKQSGFDPPSMAYLKRIRKLDDRMSMLLILTREHPDPPAFPEHIRLPPPYVISVPKTTALTMTSLKLKTSLSPIIYAPRKKCELEPWTKGKIR
ncbi:hypothetical protein K466DRAFT_599332 [Polyporus arcularius HHB13444]|uniref:Uncharacterized protein n=1 Tax=Polyporus arcularius HHB13444 TaxID=1314778 RepID=A0A5C3PDF7_9APHY|nr:hypothetical protein K466DRAFT_599332 [Polyporus arcularius HHB13444]